MILFGVESLPVVDLDSLLAREPGLWTFCWLDSVILGLVLVGLSRCAVLQSTSFLCHRLLRHVRGTRLIGRLGELVPLWDQPPLPLRRDVLSALGRHRDLGIPRIVGTRLEGHRLRGLNGILWLAWICPVLAVVHPLIHSLPGHVESSHCVVLRRLLCRRVGLVAARQLRLLTWLLSTVELPVAISSIGLFQSLQLFLSLAGDEMERRLVTTLGASAALSGPSRFVLSGARVPWIAVRLRREATEVCFLNDCTSVVGAARAAAIFLRVHGCVNMLRLLPLAVFEHVKFKISNFNSFI